MLHTFGDNYTVRYVIPVARVSMVASVSGIWNNLFGINPQALPPVIPVPHVYRTLPCHVLVKAPVAHRDTVTRLRCGKIILR